LSAVFRSPGRQKKFKEYLGLKSGLLTGDRSFSRSPLACHMLGGQRIRDGGCPHLDRDEDAWVSVGDQATIRYYPEGRQMPKGPQGRKRSAVAVK
jgi:hypothetical protein